VKEELIHAKMQKKSFRNLVKFWNVIIWNRFPTVVIAKSIFSTGLAKKKDFLIS
jgi:hypothetical protein